ncbi:ABC transporter permease [Arthrobacter caoxuetaonis]|uniref:ABC transporter permease n=1 Tax=Arthrobacter caoxuetaonis TaxID=2886935 RepID=A0A9X1MF52_9MICC|nr:ABC transporter permease [Arthrobacter caoxuetaonis]MCC3298486.1 ABC transporter permease [Arthrobacter caoxuetaonis]USQ57502.1 ABC transporter permease [Arthrobacter caoxuetaonis]
MLSLAKASIRHHRGGFAGVFIAVFLCAALITAMGVLIESGLRGGTSPQRLQAADVVVGAPQSIPVPEDLPAVFPERVLLPAGTVEEIEAVPGVQSAVGSVEIPLATADGNPVAAAAWDSAALAPYDLTAGEPPQASDEVAVDASFNTEPGSSIVLSHGGVPSEYTVSGTVEPAEGDNSGPAVFLSTAGAAVLWPHGDSVATVGVLAEPGVSPAKLAADIEAGVSGVVSYTGDRRGDVENLGGAGARSMLLLLSGSLAGVAMMTAVFVTAGTLSLSILSRRREFAMLRAVGAGANQTLGLLVREVLLVSSAAAVLGALPGFWLAGFLGGQFTAAGVIPEGFQLAFSPLPAVGAVLVSVAAAVGASLVSARGTVRAAPVTALREAVTESGRLGRGRIITGLTLLAAGLLAALLPAAVPGSAGLAAAASSILLLVVGAGVLGPWIVTGSLKLMAPLLRSSSSAPLVLAGAGAEAFPRRLAAGIVPLALALALGSVQFFMPATVESEAQRQSRDGVVAGYLASAPGGISPELADAVAALPGVETSTPMAASALLAQTRFLGMDDGVQPVGVQGVAPENLEAALDLGVREGSLDRLAEPGTVAVSTALAYESGLAPGDEFGFRYGDGAEGTAVVVAVYERGLGFGDVTMDNAALLPHTTSGLNDQLLLTAPDANPAELVPALEGLGLTVLDREELDAAGAAERGAESWVNILAMLILLGYLAVSVGNSLVMSTARRRPEMLLLRRLGATNAQLRRMTGAESALMVAAAVVVGTVLALPPLMSIALNVSGQPVPTIQPLVYLALAGGTALLGMGTVAAATRFALRPERNG